MISLIITRLEFTPVHPRGKSSKQAMFATSVACSKHNGTALKPPFNGKDGYFSFCASFSRGVLSKIYSYVCFCLGLSM